METSTAATKGADGELVNQAVPESPPRLLRRMYAALVDVYGPQYWWPAQTPLEVIVGAYLTQNTSWRAVEISIANLKAHDLLTLDALRTVPEEDLRTLIRPSGFMLRKAAALKAFIAFLDQEYNGSLDQLAAQETAIVRKQLLALPGVGPETADAILLYALEHPVMVVDEYLRRVTTRHNLIHGKAAYAEIQEIALEAFATDDAATRVQHYNEFHAVMVELGKRHCKRTPRCEGCPLSSPIFNPPQQVTLLRQGATKK
jgi:endonuclease-3 related protein